MKDDRAVSRCPHCDLNQFVPEDENCRRCHKPLWLEMRQVEREAAPEVFVCQAPAVESSNIVGRRIRELRTSAGLTQRQLAALLHTPRTYISKVENSRSVPHYRTMCAITAALGVPVFVLNEPDDVMFVMTVLVHRIPAERRAQLLAWCEHRGRMVA